jgi:isoleucyl-tRNA synthetase
LLGKEAPYKNVICLGLILDAEGQKMSKSRGNIIKPDEVMDKFGADCARFYFYTINPAGEEKRFDFKDCQVLYRKVFDTLWQSYVFFDTYTDKAKPSNKSKDILDKWIISKTERLNLEIINNLDNYDIVKSARLFIDFIDDLSNWYIRRSRNRFKYSDKEVVQTLSYVLIKTVKLIAPFAPFFSEYLYKELGGKGSVHLVDYPKPEKKLINDRLEDKMNKVRAIVMEGLAERAKAGIKVRQPLAELQIKDKLDKSLIELIKEEINVKKVSIGKEIKLDTKITKELKKEGEYRELVRSINKIRKEMNLTPKDKISISSNFEIKDIPKFKIEVGAKEFIFEDKVQGQEIEINKQKYYLLIIKN